MPLIPGNKQFILLASAHRGRKSRKLTESQMTLAAHPMETRLIAVTLRGSNVRWKHLFSAGLLSLLVTLNCSAAAINWYVPNTNYTIARNWSERILESIRMDTPHPPAQARNLFSYSVCMYDAWAAYDTNAVGFIYRGKHTAPDVAAAGWHDV